MSYTQTTWHENAMTQSQKLTGLNNLETQAASGLSYIDAFLHDVVYYTKTLTDTTFYKKGQSTDGLNAGKVDGLNKAQLQAMAVPSGSIALWGHSVASIPATWLFCNGLNQTPDARGRLLLCAGGGYNPGTTGGISTVTPYCNPFDSSETILGTNQIPKHQHTYTDYYWNLANPGESYQYQFYCGNTAILTYTTGMSGIPNASCTSHSHAANTFTFTGYYDQDNVLHSGALPVIPRSKAYAWILRR